MNDLIAKVLGYLILFGSILLKAPQILFLFAAVLFSGRSLSDSDVHRGSPAARIYLLSIMCNMKNPMVAGHDEHDIHCL
jgi:hypothetical protein